MHIYMHIYRHCDWLPADTEGARYAKFLCHGITASLGMEVEAINRWTVPWTLQDRGDGPPAPTEWTEWHPFDAAEAPSLSPARHLFDVAADPTEATDLAGMSTHITIQAALEARLAHFQALAGEPQP